MSTHIFYFLNNNEAKVFSYNEFKIEQKFKMLQTLDLDKQVLHKYFFYISIKYNT